MFVSCHLWEDGRGAPLTAVFKQAALKLIACYTCSWATQDSGRVKWLQSVSVFQLHSLRCFPHLSQVRSQLPRHNLVARGTASLHGTNTTQIYLPGIPEYRKVSIKMTLPGNPRLQVSHS